MMLLHCSAITLYFMFPMRSNKESVEIRVSVTIKYDETFYWCHEKVMPQVFTRSRFMCFKPKSCSKQYIANHM